MRNFKVTVDGNEYQVSVEEITSGGFDKPAITPIVKEAAATAPSVNVPSAVVNTPKPAPVKKTSAKGTEVKAPMPGMVLSFKAEQGSQIQKGQVILILEAMKMENEIFAPVEGKITFTVSAGSTVNTGDVLAVIS